MAPKRKAKPPNQAALAACQKPLAPGGASASVKVSILPVLMKHTLCSRHWSNNPLGMQAHSSPSPTRLRSGKTLTKVMDMVEVCLAA